MIAVPADVAVVVTNPWRNYEQNVLRRMGLRRVQGKGEHLKQEIREALAKGFLFVLDEVC